MPRVNIWLQEELHRQVKEAGLPVSEVCQHALVQELDRRAHRHLTQPIPGQITFGEEQEEAWPRRLK